MDALDKAFLCALCVPSAEMGLINNSPYTFKSGPTCTGTYMRVNTPIHCVMGSDGKYFAKGALMTYYNQEARIKELDPMEIGDIELEIDPSGVFQVVFDGLKKTFTNCTDVIDPVIEQPTEPAVEPTPAAEPAPTEPAPTEPAPTEPAPTEPAPTEPAPAT